MATSTEQKIGIGCGVLVAGWVFLAAIAKLLDMYFTTATVGNALVGVFLGALAGAGIGTVFPDLSKHYRKKAKVGPLPPSSCFTDSSNVVRLRERYLTDKKYEWWQFLTLAELAPSLMLLAFVLAMGIFFTIIEHRSVNPDRKARGAVTTSQGSNGGDGQFGSGMASNGAGAGGTGVNSPGTPALFHNGPTAPRPGFGQSMGPTSSESAAPIESGGGLSVTLPDGHTLGSLNFKSRSDFASASQYGQYVKENLRVGMEVQAIVSHGAVKSGFRGIYYGTNHGRPPCFVIWDHDLGSHPFHPPTGAPPERLSSGYWVEWYQVQILQYPVDGPPKLISTELGVSPPVETSGPIAEPPQVASKTPSNDAWAPAVTTPAAKPAPPANLLTGQWRLSTGERLNIEDSGNAIVLTLQSDTTRGSNRTTFSQFKGTLSRRSSQPDYFDGIVYVTSRSHGTYSGKTIGHLKAPTILELRATFEVPMRIKGNTYTATRYHTYTLTKEN